MNTSFFRLCLLAVLFILRSPVVRATELITNGGFETTGTGFTWVLQTNGTNRTDSWWNIPNSSGAHGGSRYEYLGAQIDGSSAANNVDGLLYQTVTIPSGTTSAILSYYLRITTSEIANGDYDDLYLEIQNTNGTVLGNYHYSNLDAPQYASWTQELFDLTQYAGQTIRVAFHGTTDSNTITVFRIDDVSLQASGGGQAPTAQTLAASSVTTTSAQLNASISPNGSATSAYFEYGTTTSYGTATGSGNFGSGTSNIGIQSTLTSLASNTTFHYRVVATNSNGTSRGSDATFTTSALTPVLSVSPTSASPSSSSGSSNFNVSNTGGGTMSYSASVTSGSSWLSISSGGSGGNSGTIIASYLANAGAQRSGTIQVTASGASGSPAIITVTQSSSNSANLFVGKGDWIHNINTCIQNVPLTTHTLQGLIDWEKSKGIQYLIVKAGQGDHYYPLSGTKLDATLVQMCHTAGIKVFGWHYAYGGAYDPAWDEDTSVTQEIQIAQQILATGCDGLVIDAELEYEDGQPSYRYRKYGGTLPSAASAADSYCQGIFAGYPRACL